MTRVPAVLATTVVCLVAALSAPPGQAAVPDPGRQAPVVRQAPHSLPHAPGHRRGASGTLLDDAVAPMSYPGLPAPAPARAAAVPARARILVMRVFWSSAPPKYPDTGQMRALMKDTARWFSKASRGRHHVSSKVTPWLRVPGGSANCYDLYGSTRRAVAAARAHGTGPGGFNRYMLVMPQCGTNSQGEMPGRVTWIRERLTHLDVLTHELGHNLGLDHANSLICRADKRRVTQGGSCSSQEYGDVWDAMGISTRPYSVPVLQRLGWAGRTATATKSGTWSLRDAEASGSGLQGLRVKVSGSTSYWLEYHTTDVASAKEPGSFAITGTPGVQVRLDTGQRSLRLLDAAPGNPDQHLTYPDPDFVNATLPVGSSFTTPQRVRITLLSQDADGARVRVSFGKRAGVPDAPTLVSAVAEPGSYSRTARLSIVPGASDNGQVVLGYLATRYPGGESTFVADPGGRHGTLTLDYSGKVPEQWTVRAVNQVGTSAESAKVATHTPAPVVTLVSPTPGSAVPGPTVHVALDVQPDPLTHTPVRSVTVCLDDYDCQTDDAAPWAVDLAASDGPHALRAVARDNDGAEGAASTTVTVVPSPPTVTISAPAAGSTLVTGQPFTVTAAPAPNASTGSPITTVYLTVRAGSSTYDSAAVDAPPWSTSFTVDVAGTYQVQAVARDANGYESTAASITVVVQDPP